MSCPDPFASPAKARQKQPAWPPRSSLDQPAPETIPSGLYIVATPIGNLDDVSLRALRVLAAADRVYAEDTRRTRILLERHAIARHCYAYHDHNGAQIRPSVLACLREGGRVALVSDAGTPLVCDPGLKLVREAIAAEIAVYPVPGACAMLAGLVASGLDPDRFIFVGFPPPKAAARRALFAQLSSIQATLIFYEGPSRLIASLADMAACFGHREAVLAREITKLHESCVRAPLPELAQHIADTGVPRGEFVLLVASPLAREVSEASEEAKAQKLESLLRLADPNCSTGECAAILAAQTGQPRRDMYRRLVAQRQGRSDAKP